ncbi:hypothetical protein Dsin_032134 [Dipteronia sinensis]|uniref:RNase H type-1 domain-containing protein n=1 Tax=Dipteronia sinensis TaxID=43782 RepID=A0AAE0DSW4_9ROSI|nr:hypothetical protein Dsin_032134 [Dipteronia sinensis]
MGLWRIWFNRNLLVHNKSGRDSDELVSWVAELLEEFQGTRKSFNSSLSSASVVVKDGWHPSPSGGLKLNTDAAVLQGGNSFGIGAVIRDSKGKVVLALSKFFHGCFSIEVDATNVAAGMNSTEPCRSVACFVFNDISGLCKDVGVSKCKAISRCGNGVAHNFASLAVSSSRDQLWQGHCHSSLFSGY